MASGLDRIVGCTLKNSTRSVRNSDWSAMVENVAKSAWMPPFAPSERSGEELQVAPAQIAVHRPEDDVRVRAVVAARADDREERARQQAAAGEPDVLVVELIGQPRVFARHEGREPEQLQLFGRFLARSEQPQVIEAPARGRLLDVEGVAEKREVAFTEERRHHREHQRRQRATARNRRCSPRA